MLVATLLGLVVVGAAPFDPFDDYVDELLRDVDVELAHSGYDTYALPDFSHRFDEKVFGVDLKGEVLVQGARLSNLSSLVRVGDADPQDSGNNVTLGLGLSLADLSLRCDLVQFTFLGVNWVHTGFTADLKHNAVQLMVSYSNTGEAFCVNDLGINVTSLGDITVDLQPLTFVNKVKSWLASEALSAAAPLLRSKLSEAVSTAIQGLRDKYAGLCVPY